MFFLLSTSIRALFTLVIYFSVSLPVFSYHPDDMTTHVYNDVALTCEAVGFGSITVTWKRISLELPDTATQSDTKSGDLFTSILRITRTNGYYAGQYYCIAENSAGKVTSEIAKLDVIGTKILLFACTA